MLISTNLKIVFWISLILYVLGVAVSVISAPHDGCGLLVDCR